MITAMIASLLVNNLSTTTDLGEQHDQHSIGLIEVGTVSNRAESSGGCELGSGEITGLGSGSTVVAVSSDGTPDLSSLDPGLFCRTSSMCCLQTCPSSRWTRQECDEGCCNPVLGCHFCLDKRSHSRIMSPTAIFSELGMLVMVHHNLFLLTSGEVWSHQIERHVHSSLCRKSLAGEDPVVAWWLLL